MRAPDMKAPRRRGSGRGWKAAWQLIFRHRFYSATLVEVFVVATASGVIGAQIAAWWRP